MLLLSKLSFIMMKWNGFVKDSVETFEKHPLSPDFGVRLKRN